MTDITLISASDQASLLAGGDLSATEALEAAVRTYERHNPALNAVVVEQIDQAQARAAGLDALHAKGESAGPLHGVPMTIKEVFDWVGTPSTWGDARLVDYHPPRNALAVQRLLDAGAVIWGKTNVPFQLGEWQSYNVIYGRTNNPWDLGRTPGGSSGGSAAAVATGMAALELGSDIGGSIRFPAHYCGVFGHKPTFSLVPIAGHTYPGQEAEVDINVGGPLARTAADLELAMRVLAKHPMADEPRTSLSEFTVGVMLENPFGEQDDELTAALEQAIGALVRAGLKVSTVSHPADLVRGHQLYGQLVRSATSVLDWTPEHERHAARYDSGERDYEAIGGKGVMLPHVAWIELNNERERLRASWANYFESVDLLLCPPSASAATPHDTDTPFADQMIPVNGELRSTAEQWFWAGIASGPYLPSTAMPIGRTEGGLPLGVQIIGPDSHDLRSIRFAGLVEAELGGFRAPPMLAG